MKLFGLEITRTKPFLGSEMEKFDLQVVKMNVKKTSLFEAIAFPHLDLSDPMVSTLFTKSVREMEESFVRYQHMNICPVRDISNLAGMTLTGAASEAFEWLKKLHCVDFKDMHEVIAKQLPHRINMVFANGNYKYPWREVSDGRHEGSI